jgi:nitroreductase
MTTAFTTLLQTRTSANNFDASQSLSDEQITELVSLATLAPSSFNAQNWGFIAVRTPEAKAQLKALAYGQAKVTDAAVTFIVVGKLEMHKGLPSAVKPLLDAGAIDQAAYDGWIGMANGMYEGNAQIQRDEAVRSGSLAGMTLMLAAQDQGLASGPMIGFDAAGVSAAFGLSATELPVMLIAVGPAAAGNWPQKPRRPIADVLRFA